MNALCKSAEWLTCTPKETAFRYSVCWVRVTRTGFDKSPSRGRFIGISRVNFLLGKYLSVTKPVGREVPHGPDSVSTNLYKYCVQRRVKLTREKQMSGIRHENKVC